MPAAITEGNGTFSTLIQDIRNIFKNKEIKFSKTSEELLDTIRLMFLIFFALNWIVKFFARKLYQDEAKKKLNELKAQIKAYGPPKLQNNTQDVLSELYTPITPLKAQHPNILPWTIKKPTVKPIDGGFK